MYASCELSRLPGCGTVGHMVPLTGGRKPLQQAQQLSDLLQSHLDILIGEPTLVEIGMQGTSISEQIADSGLFQFAGDPARHPEQVAVTFVTPAPLLGNRLHCVGRRAPAFLRRLHDIASAKFLPCLLEHASARLYVKIDRCQYRPLMKCLR